MESNPGYLLEPFFLQNCFFNSYLGLESGHGGPANWLQLNDLTGTNVVVVVQNSL